MGLQAAPSIQCQNCKHLFEDTIEIEIGEAIESDLLSACLAFPLGIPDDIMDGEFNHRKKFPGQKNNIVFEPIRKKIVKK